MLSLFESERFQAEYQKFLNEIELVDNLNLKLKLTRLVNDLASAVKELDSEYCVAMYHQATPNLNSTKNKILKIRKEIYQSLKTKP